MRERFTVHRGGKMSDWTPATMTRTPMPAADTPTAPASWISRNWQWLVSGAAGVLCALGGAAWIGGGHVTLVDTQLAAIAVASKSTTDTLTATTAQTTANTAEIRSAKEAHLVLVEHVNKVDTAITVLVHDVGEIKTSLAIMADRTRQPLRDAP